MLDRKTTREAAKTLAVVLYTVCFVAYSAWFFHRLVRGINRDSWALEPVGILLLGEMAVDEVLERIYENGKVSEVQHWWSMVTNFAFFTSFRLCLDPEAWALVKGGVVGLLGSILGVCGAEGALLMMAFWYWRLPETSEGHIRLPLWNEKA
ncbi:hypothetical protein CJU89_4013 [Yarrowia sp. B02]|nr:hypothetical protein CJU89_4013 [Yarrowia sp. B02]